MANFLGIGFTPYDMRQDARIASITTSTQSVEDVSGRVLTLEQTTSTHQTNISTLLSTISTLQTQLTALQSQIETLQAQITAAAEFLTVIDESIEFQDYSGYSNPG